MYDEVRKLRRRVLWLLVIVAAGCCYILWDRDRRADQARSERLEREANLARRDAATFKAMCARQNEDRATFRRLAVAQADGLGRLIVEYVDNRQVARLVAERLHDDAERAAAAIAGDVDCSYPPTNTGGPR